MKKALLGTIVMLLLLAALTGCLSLWYEQELEPGQPVKKDQIYFVGRLTMDIEVEHGRAGQLKDKVTLFFEHENTVKAVLVDNSSDFFFVILPRNDYRFRGFEIVVGLKGGSTSLISYDLLEPVQYKFREDDTFVYIGDIKLELVHKNIYGRFSPVVTIEDRFLEAEKACSGYVVDGSGNPVEAQNRSASGEILLSKSPDKVETHNVHFYKVNIEKGHGETAFDPQVGDLSVSGKLVVLSVDSYMDALNISSALAGELSRTTTLQVMGESELRAALPAYPAQINSGKQELQSEDERLLIEIGKTLGADYVFAFARQSSIIRLATSSGPLARVKLHYYQWMVGNLFQVATGKLVGVTDYYVQKGGMPVSYPLSNTQRDELFNEVANIMAKDIAAAMKKYTGKR